MHLANFVYLKRDFISMFTTECLIVKVPYIFQTWLVSVQCGRFPKFTQVIYCLGFVTAMGCAVCKVSAMQSVDLDAILLTSCTKKRYFHCKRNCLVKKLASSLIVFLTGFIHL